jgi:hypothetical protein
MRRIAKIGHNGSPQISKSELEKYYLLLNKSKETTWKEKLGQNLNGHYLLRGFLPF